MVERYGADVLRLYVASMDYADDISVSERGIKEMSEAYRKIRNTFRYLLGNLEDYQRFDALDIEPGTMHEIDVWVLGQLNGVVRDVRAAYERFEFYKVYQRIYQFCAVDLSSFYLDVLKDRLYAELPAGPDRRAAQFVLARLHDHLTRLLAPIIPHTAEESWDYRPALGDKPASVHLAEFPEADARWDDPERTTNWNELLALREQVLAALEGLRKNKQIGSAQEARVRITTNRFEHWARFQERFPGLLATLCIVSEVEFVPDTGSLTECVEADRSPYAKCERCWNYRPTVGQSAEHPTLCDRCVRVIQELNVVGTEPPRSVK
jgi:isoleucyl-tRNA synthetase